MSRNGHFRIFLFKNRAQFVIISELSYLKLMAIKNTEIKS